MEKHIVHHLQIKEINHVLNLLKKKHCPILGIDINSVSVNILQLSKTRDQYCVDGYERFLIPDGVVETGLIQHIDAVANYIRALCSRKTISSKQAVVAVPNAYVINKIIQISARIPQQDIEEQVYLNAEKYIPFPINEINLDFKILGPSLNNDAQLDVLIVVSRTEIINQRVEALQRAGLSVQIVDIETHAIERAMHILAGKNGYEKVIAMIDVDSNYIRCYVFHKMNIIFSREDILLLALEEVHQAIPAAFFEQFILQIKRALQFFTISHQVSIDQIVLSGRGVLLPGFAEFLESKLNIPTQLANPFRQMTYASKQIQDSIHSSSPLLMVVCGLALRGCEKTSYA